MSNRNGASFPYLLFEDRDNRTIRAEDIAETSSNKLCLWVLNVLKVRVVLKGSVGNSSVQSLAINLTDAL